MRYVARLIVIGIIGLPLLSVFAKTPEVGSEATTYRETEMLLSELRFGQAQVLISSMSNPGYQAFYQSNLQAYQALASMDPQLRESYRVAWPKLATLVAKIGQQDSLKEILMADLEAKRAMIEMVDHNYLTAARYARSSKKNLEQSRLRYGLLIEQMKLQGVFEVLLGSLPEKYHWIAHPLGLSGNVQTGIRYLQLSAAHARLFNTEAQILLCLMDKNILNRPEQALQRLERYRQRVQRPSILVDFFLASGYQSIKQNDKSLLILQDQAKYSGGAVYPMPFWDYLLGKAHAYRGESMAAQKSFTRFLSVYRGDLFRMDALFRTGMALTLAGNHTTGKAYFQQMLVQTKSNQFDEDEYAVAMARRFLQEQPGPVELSLFRARNLFDGGYLDQSSGLLTETRERYAMRPHEWVEWHYRMARILHTKGDLAEASLAYRRSLTYTANPFSSWMLPYSAYFLGEIAKEQGDKAAARTWYNAALGYDGYFYQAGIENRCKAALAQLDQPKTQASSSRP